MSTPSRPSVLAGVVAGIAGTTVYTIVGAALKRRNVGMTADAQPADVAAALAGSARRRGVNAALHWGYGVCGGVARIGLVRAGLSGWRLNLVHLAVLWLPWRALLALSGKGKPRDCGALLVDGGRHLVYVLGAGTILRLLGRRPSDVKG